MNAAVLVDAIAASLTQAPPAGVTAAYVASFFRRNRWAVMAVVENELTRAARAAQRAAPVAAYSPELAGKRSRYGVLAAKINAGSRARGVWAEYQALGAELAQLEGRTWEVWRRTPRDPRWYALYTQLSREGAEDKAAEMASQGFVGEHVVVAAGQTPEGTPTYGEVPAPSPGSPPPKKYGSLTARQVGKLQAWSDAHPDVTSFEDLPAGLWAELGVDRHERAHQDIDRYLEERHFKRRDERTEYLRRPEHDAAGGTGPLTPYGSDG